MAWSFQGAFATWNFSTSKYLTHTVSKLMIKMKCYLSYGLGVIFGREKQRTSTQSHKQITGSFFLDNGKSGGSSGVSGSCPWWTLGLSSLRTSGCSHLSWHLLQILGRMNGQIKGEMAGDCWALLSPAPTLTFWGAFLKTLSNSFSLYTLFRATSHAIPSTKEVWKYFYLGMLLSPTKLELVSKEGEKVYHSDN